jgi:transcriptional regulator with XRE-family HTH domain
MSQEEAARRSGISRRTLWGAEHGENPTLLTLVRLLRTYGRLGSLDAFIPESELSPMDIVMGPGRHRA